MLDILNEDDSHLRLIKKKEETLIGEIIFCLSENLIKNKRRNLFIFKTALK